MDDFDEWTSHSRPAYTNVQVSEWLRRICLPAAYARYIECPSTIPKTEDILFTLFRCQITTFPYENLSLHYSQTHQISIKPVDIYAKLMAPDNRRGGYCMELSIFFHHMLSRLGFHIYMTGVRNRSRTDSGVPQGEYQGWTHINNIVHLPCGSKFSMDVGFGGSGPTSPLRMDENAVAVPNLGKQSVRLVHDNIPKQNIQQPKLWIYQYRNSSDAEWNSFYSFSEVEFFQEDFEVLNWWTSAKTFHAWTVLAVRFVRERELIELDQNEVRVATPAEEVKIVGKVILIDRVVKLNTGGSTRVVHQFESEDGRREALEKYFGIHLTDQDFQSIRDYSTALEVAKSSEH